MGAALGCSCETSQDQPEISLIQPVNKEGNRRGYQNADNSEFDMSASAAMGYPEENRQEGAGDNQ
jgi:hypothetical protein